MSTYTHWFTKISLSMLLALLLLNPNVVLQAQEGQAFLPVITARAAEKKGQSDEERAIQLLAKVPDMALHLAAYPGWVGHAYATDGSGETWQVDLHDAQEEWIGNGTVNLKRNEVISYYAPRELTTEELQAGLRQVEPFLAHDPEVQARMVFPAFWQHNTAWNRWEQKFESWYWWGVKAFVVRTYIDKVDQKVYVDEIYDPHVLEAKKEAERQRNKAIEIAWSAPGIDQALANVDNWHIYVEAQSAIIYTVEFTADGQELFQAVVNIEQGNVIEPGE